MNMLGLAKRVKARFLLASTSEVYGDPQEHPQTETYFGEPQAYVIRRGHSRSELSLLSFFRTRQSHRTKSLL